MGLGERMPQFRWLPLLGQHLVPVFQRSAPREHEGAELDAPHHVICKEENQGN